MNNLLGGVSSVAEGGKVSSQYPIVTDNKSNKPEKSDDGCVWWVLAIILLIGLFSPIDPIPDVIPVAGWLDDVGYIAGLLYILSRR